MRRIEPSNAFKRDYKRESRGRHRAILEGELAHRIPDPNRLQLVRLGSHSELGM